MFDRYRGAVSHIPPSGEGYNLAILGAANLGVMAGVDPETIFSDIRANTKPGKRRIADAEIWRAINRALTDHHRGPFKPRPRPVPVVDDGKEALGRIIEQGKYTTEDELIKSSPVPIPDDPWLHTKIFITTLFMPPDLLFNGDRYQSGVVGDTIKDAIDFLTYLIDGGKTAPFIIINPLTGKPAMKKSGDGETYRGDGNIAKFLHCLVEFDNLSREEQIRFWSAAKLPVIALIDSGNKSIHAWLQVSQLAKVITMDQWDAEIKRRLYDRILAPLGVDAACSNPARLSRLPGHFREEKGTWQRLLWLSPIGGAL